MQVNGAYHSTIGDEEPFVIGRGELLGRGYPLHVEEGNIFVEITSMFGSSIKSTENGIIVGLDAGRVAYNDASALEVGAFTLEEGGDVFVTFENAGSGTVYFRPDATVLLGGKSTKIKSDTLYSLGVGEAEIVKFPGILGSAEGEVEVAAGANYGSREAFLEKRAEKSHLFAVKAPVEEAGFDMNLLFLAVILLLVAVIVYLVLGRKKEEKKKK